MSITETHYQPSDLAEKWGVSAFKIRELFQDEPGVIRIGNPATRFKRKRYLLRIPESVAERVYRRITIRTA
jgi:hypothetical protein